MRLVGEFAKKREAQRLADYLTGQEYDSQVRSHEGQYEVWVLDDDHLDTARRVYEEFKQNPSDPKFEQGVKVRAAKERQQQRQLRQHYRNYFKRPSGNQLTITLIVVCVIIYFLTLTQWRNPIFYSLIISLSGYPATTVWASQPWRLFTPMFLHFSIWHILFNMFWLYDLGSLVETQDGRWFYIIFILVSSLVSGLLQFAVAGPMFGGMSGVVYALFAYIWISAKYNLRSGYYMSNQIVLWMVGWFVLCFTGLLGPVANYGHLGGLLAGTGFALLRKLLKK